MIETKVYIYDSQREMQKNIKLMEKRGWTVASVQVIQPEYGFLKTCCLGALFLPLALLGRKPEKYQVTYQQEKRSKG